MEDGEERSGKHHQQALLPPDSSSIYRGALGEAKASTRAKSPPLRTLAQEEVFKAKVRGKRLTALMSAALSFPLVSPRQPASAFQFCLSPLIFLPSVCLF